MIVSGGDASSYNYSWIPILPNNSGPHQVCPTTTTQYIVTVSDLGPANTQSDTVTIVVVPPTTTQARTKWIYLNLKILKILLLN